MPQIKSQFTEEQRLAFEEKHNLWVYSHEALVELLMKLDQSNLEAIIHNLDLEKRVHAMEEMLVSLSEYIKK